MEITRSNDTMRELMDTPLDSIREAGAQYVDREVYDVQTQSLEDVTGDDIFKDVEEDVDYCQDEDIRETLECGKRVAEKIVEGVAVVVPGGQGVAVEMAAKEVAENVVKECAKAVVKEIAKNTVSGIIDATESESLQKLKTPIVNAVDKKIEASSPDVKGGTLKDEDLGEAKGPMPRYGENLDYNYVQEKMDAKELTNDVCKIKNQEVAEESLPSVQMDSGVVNMEHSGICLGRERVSDDLLDDALVCKFRNSDGLLKRLPREGTWEGEEGNSLWIPDVSKLPIFKKYGIDGIYFTDGEPDFSPVAVDEVEIEKITDNRAKNFAAARAALAEKWNKEAKEGCTDWNGQKVQEYLKKHNLTLHECGDRKTVQVVPREIHENTPHSGGVSAAKSETVEQHNSEGAETGVSGTPSAENVEISTSNTTNS